MESLFNLTWVLVAMTSICFWLRSGQRSRGGGHSSLVGLAMLVVILFPVISVSDDLWSLQNPAETDTCHRRDQNGGHSQTHFPAAAALSEPSYAVPSFGFVSLEIPSPERHHGIANPALQAIENRPPPAL